MRGKDEGVSVVTGTVLVATAFGVLFEHSTRGFGGLLSEPWLPLLIVGVYLSYYVVIEDLILRFRLRDYQAGIVGAALATTYRCFMSGSAFAMPTFLGINWPQYFYIAVVSWAAIQTVMAFYIATRISPRDWSRKPLPPVLWLAVLLLNALATLVLQSGGRMPQGTALGRVALVTMLVLSGILFVRTVLHSTDESPRFRADALMDFLSAVSVVVFLISAVVTTMAPLRPSTMHLLAPTTRVVTIWATFSTLTMIYYRFTSMSPISV